MGVLAIALLLTFSRGAFVGCVMVNVAVPASGSSTPGRVAPRAARRLASTAAACRARSSGAHDASASAAAPTSTVSAGRDRRIWLPLLPELWKSPLWGNGLDSIMWSYAMWTEHRCCPSATRTTPTSQAMLDMGLVGLGAAARLLLARVDGASATSAATPTSARRCAASSRARRPACSASSSPASPARACGRRRSSPSSGSPSASCTACSPGGRD